MENRLEISVPSCEPDQCTISHNGTSYWRQSSERQGKVDEMSDIMHIYEITNDIKRVLKLSIIPTSAVNGKVYNSGYIYIEREKAQFY